MKEFFLKISLVKTDNPIEVNKINDKDAKTSMRALYNPIKDDAKIISGESGAAGLAGLIKCLKDPALSELKNHIGLSSKSRVLVFNTEGDTDKNSFKSIIGL